MIRSRPHLGFWSKRLFLDITQYKPRFQRFKIPEISITRLPLEFSIKICKVFTLVNSVAFGILDNQQKMNICRYTAQGMWLVGSKRWLVEAKQAFVCS